MTCISLILLFLICKKLCLSHFSPGNHPGSTSTMTSQQQGQWPENASRKWWPLPDRVIRGEKSTHVQGDTLCCAKPPVDLKTKVLPGQAMPGQAKTELLF